MNDLTLSIFRKIRKVDGFLGDYRFGGIVKFVDVDCEGLLLGVIFSTRFLNYVSIPGLSLSN
jgi:hypothetical protein